MSSLSSYLGSGINGLVPTRAVSRTGIYAVSRNYLRPGNAVSTTGGISETATKTSPALNTWYTILDITSARGVLYFYSVYKPSSNNFEVAGRVTIDGVVIRDITASTSSTTNAGIEIVGFRGSSSSAFALEPLLFNDSMKLELKMGTGGAGDLDCSYAYDLRG